MIPDPHPEGGRGDVLPQAPMKLDDDDFTLLGLPQRHAVDASLLATRWRQLQARVHPDRFASEGARAQRIAMQWAVRVNEAYRRLKDPLQRAAYICELRGVAVDAERNTAMPASFLQQQMQWREALDDAADPAAVERIAADVAANEAVLLADVQRRLDVAGDAIGAVGVVRALMFVARFRRDIESRLGAFDDAAAMAASAARRPAHGTAADL